MYAVTGASGQLGNHVLKALLESVPPQEIVALVRDPSKPLPGIDADVVVRAFDYTQADTLAPALEGVERLLLISSNAVGQREAQHGAVIDAAKAAGVKLIAYTSILDADHSPLALAADHKVTEALIKASGIPYAFLRNGWYTENFVENAAPAVEHGALLGSAGEGKISTASRADYAKAAAVVLTGAIDGAQTLELAGDTALTEGAFAAALAEVTGKPVAYVFLPEADYAAALEKAGVPSGFAQILADSSAKSATGALYNDSHTLSTLIGRPTTDWHETLCAAFGK